MTFLSSPSHTFSPWPLIVSLMTTGSIWPTERKGKKKKKEPGSKNNQKKASKKETIFSQFYLNSLREKGVGGFFTLRTISFSSPFVYTSCVSGRGQFHPALTLHPGASFWLRTAVSPLRKWDTERRRRKRDQEESTLFSLFFPPWSCEKKVFF